MRAGHRAFGSAACLAVLQLGLALPALAEAGVPAAETSTPSAHSPDPLFDDDDEDAEGASRGFPDPWEATNRGVLGFNALADRFFLDPLTHAYRLVFPDPVRKAVLRFFWNLDTPPIFLNDILQLEWKDAGVTGARFLVNSTVGLAGFFDPATSIGLERHVSDFGQTLALAGVPSGNYVVLPLLGPSCIRDGVGIATDLAMRPLIYILTPVGLIAYGGSVGLTTREAYMDAIGELQDSSIDYYAVLRNVYYQSRLEAVWGRRQDRGPEAVAALR